jgi:hypothetical protein
MWMASLQLAVMGRKLLFRCGVAACAMTFPVAAWGQASGAGGQAPSDAAPPPAEPPAAPPEPAPPPAAPAKPPLFTFTLKGFVSGMMYMQDAAFASGNGNGAIFSPNKIDSGRWFLSGDVRQTQLKFMLKGPEVFGGATPTAVVEVDFFGGNQITTVPGATSVVTIRDATGKEIGTGVVSNTTTGSAMGDESVLPRLRLAYAELNWGGGKEMLRVGQQHNLLIPMIPASASHIGVPLGYGAGALGWRTPGVTYLQKVSVAQETNLDLALQINRNSWIDNFPTCPAPPAPQPPTAGANCLPYGVSLGEASTLPQVEARAMLSGGKSESPWLPYYPNNVWQVYLVGHWDQKRLSGLGSAATPPARDTMDTLVGELGLKVQLGPVIVAGNGWYGKNSGGVFGNLLQMQTADRPDVSGFGAWGQLGFSITKELSAWAFGGVDQPNQDDAIAAGFTRLHNLQAAGMISYRDGPYAIAAEYLHIATQMYTPATKAMTTFHGNQPSLSVAYFF